MLYLLDADTLITGDRKAYPLKRFPIFWDWLRYQGAEGNVKVPLEQFEEVTSGRGELVDWLLLDETKSALLFDQEADPAPRPILNLLCRRCRRKSDCRQLRGFGARKTAGKA